MHVEIDQQSLRTALQHISAGVPARSVSPILMGVKLESSTDGLTLTACNTSVTLQYFISCASDTLIIHNEGSTVIPARYFIDIIRSLSEGMVTLEEMQNCFIRISSGHAVYRLAAMSADDFPVAAIPERNNGFSISNVELKQMVKQVAFAAATSESKPVLTGVLCQTDEHKLTFAATDGIRLSTRTTRHSANSVSSFPSVVIPAKHLSDYTKMLHNESGTTRITLSDHSIYFQTRNFSMLSLLIAGEFPSINRLIPKTFSTEISMDAASLLSSVLRAGLLAGPTHVVGIRITDTEAEMFAASAAVGDVSEKIAIQSFIGDPLTVFFNVTYLKDVLLAIETSQLRLHFTGRENPFVIQPSTSPNAQYIITPVRTAYREA
ncbi:DNA polymerase III subunit beta [Paenibacillus paridis]|uniref:DNA polymerase III subunit beta n=1 Tax=Paenibacillus paridis TaxID=2583376 RepID=UPI0011222A56|nr:DNA polymerase III subunit beta [Paenibacillus paridis]